MTAMTDDEVEQARLAAEDQAPDGGRWHTDAVKAARQAPVVDDPDDDELGGDGGDGQVEALDPHRRQAENKPHHPGHQPRADQPHQERHLEAVGQDGGGIGADGDEAGVPDGKLAAVADQDIQPDGRNEGDADEVDHAQPVVAEIKRHGEEHGQEGDEQHPVRPGAQDGHVLGVA